MESACTSVAGRHTPEGSFFMSTYIVKIEGTREELEIRGHADGQISLLIEDWESEISNSIFVNADELIGAIKHIQSLMDNKIKTDDPSSISGGGVVTRPR